MNPNLERLQQITRRQFLKTSGQLSLGAIALQTLGGGSLASEVINPLAPKHPHFRPKAKRIISYAWQRDPFTDGAYALYKPGQWFGIRPILQRPHGKVLFAGEHIADWQGFMEGAIETGEAAAEALIGQKRDS